MLLLVLGEQLLPVAVQLAPRLPSVSWKCLGTSGGTRNLRVGRPAVGFFGLGDFFGAERFAVRLGVFALFGAP